MLVQILMSLWMSVVREKPAFLTEQKTDRWIKKLLLIASMSVFETELESNFSVAVSPSSGLQQPMVKFAIWGLSAALWLLECGQMPSGFDWKWTRFHASKYYSAKRQQWLIAVAFCVVMSLTEFWKTDTWLYQNLNMLFVSVGCLGQNQAWYMI